MLRLIGEDGSITATTAPTTGHASPFLLGTPFGQVRAGLRYWTADEWDRELDKPSDGVIEFPGGVRIEVSPYDPSIHASDWSALN